MSFGVKLAQMNGMKRRQIYQTTLIQSLFSLMLSLAPFISSAATVQTRSIPMIGFDLTQESLASKKLLNCPESFLCVPIATANSYQLCENVLRHSKLNPVNEVIEVAETLSEEVRTKGMHTSRGIEILKKMNPELVRQYRLRPMSFARRQNESFKAHFRRIHRALKSSLTKGFAPVVELESLYGIEAAEGYVLRSHFVHALTVTAVQDIIEKTENSFLIEVFDPDDGIPIRLTLTSPEGLKPFASKVETGFNKDNHPTEGFSEDLNLRSPHLLVTATPTMSLGLSSTPLRSRDMILFKNGFGSFSQSR